jgi:tetratricopeptide (TPR) repeat protein
MSDDKEYLDGAGGGNLFYLFRWASGEHTQSDFAARTGIQPSEINRMEKGRQRPRPATFKKLQAGARIPDRLLDFFRWAYRLLRQARTMAAKIDVPPSQLSEDLRRASWEATERSIALGRMTCRLRRLQQPGPSMEQDREKVERLFEKLKSFSPSEQRLLLEVSASYRDPLLCLRFCRESESAAAHDTDIAMRLAQTALLISRHVPEALQARAQGWCQGFIGNVQRVIGGDFQAAEKSFAQAWRLWREGQDPAGLFSEAYLLDLEASLRRAQRRFNQALKLHSDAMALATPDEAGAILLNRAVTYQHQTKSEEALKTLAKAVEVIDGNRQPRLLYGALFNRASNLLLLGRIEEAAPLVPEVRRLADRLGNGIDGIRTTWLEANCAAGLGRREEALEKLDKVREGFEKKLLPFDYALASLDAILLYREENRFPEIKTLAAEILTFFQAQNVHREAIAAILLLQEAAEQEKITTGLVQRLKDYLTQASRKPGVRFGG